MKLAAAQVKRRFPIAVGLLLWILGGCGMQPSIRSNIGFCNSEDYYRSPLSAGYDKFSLEALDIIEKIKLHRSMRRLIDIYFDYYFWIPLWGDIQRDKSRFAFDLDSFFRNREVVLDVATIVHEKTHSGHSWTTYILYNHSLYEYLISRPLQGTAITIEERDPIDPNVKPVTVRFLRLETRPPPRPEVPQIFGCVVYYSVDGPGDVNYQVGEGWFSCNSYDIPEDVLERELKK